MERTTDTIAAVATPAGPGAIGILRLSGPEAVSAASAAFRAADSRPLEAHPPPPPDLRRPAGPGGGGHRQGAGHLYPGPGLLHR